MAKVVSVIALKGGTGKTTLAVSLASVWWGKSLVLDLDPQKSATAWKTEAMNRGRVRKPARPTDLRPQFFFVGEDVRTLDLEGSETRRKQVFGAAVDQAEADVGSNGLVVLDTPPQLSDSAKWAATVSDLVLIPIEPSMLSFRAIEQSMDMLSEVRRKREAGPRVMFVPSRVFPTTLISKELVELLETLKESVGTPIRHRTAYAQLVSDGLTVGCLGSRNPARVEVEELCKQIRGVLR